MMKIARWFLLTLFFLAVGCVSEPLAGSTNQPGPNDNTGSSQIDYAYLPNVEQTAEAYLDAWVRGDYPSMYTLLTSISQDAISEEEFIQHYEGVVKEAGLVGVTYNILSSLTNPDTAQVGYRVILDSVLVGEIHADTMMNLSLEDGEWRVQWDDTLILPQLKGGNYLVMDRSDYIPARANIYDRYGRALVAQTDATAIGLYPDKINPEQEQRLLTELSDLLSMSPDAIKAMYANFPSGAGWYLPLGEVPVDRIVGRYDYLSEFDGLVLRGYKARYYSDGGIAAHLIGYTSAIPADELQEYLLKGYLPDERVGRSGLEKWGEE